MHCSRIQKQRMNFVIYMWLKLFCANSIYIIGLLSCYVLFSSSGVGNSYKGSSSGTDRIQKYIKGRCWKAIGQIQARSTKHTDTKEESERKIEWEVESEDSGEEETAGKHRTISK